MSDFESALHTGAGNSFKFAEVGDKIVGTVTGKSIVASTDFDGNPVDVPVVTIQAEDAEYDVWLAKKALAGAVGRALSAVGPGTKLEVGGQLAIVREADGVAKKAGHNAPHLYSAQYRPPAKAAASAPAPEAQAAAPSASDLFGD